jgi:hypothetical protein
MISRILTPNEAKLMILRPPSTGMPIFLIDTNIFIDRIDSIRVNPNWSVAKTQQIHDALELWKTHFVHNESYFYITLSILGELGVQPYQTYFGRNRR